MAQARTDAELIDRFVNGQDDSAFAEIVSRHGKMVYRVCREILHDGIEAEDAVQEVFVLLTRKAASLKNTNKLAAWLFGVARNVSRRMFRKRTMCCDNETIEDLNNPDMSEDDLERMGADCFDSLYDAIAGLSDLQQQAVLLRYLKGYSEKDSARLAGCEENTLAKRASNAVAQLRATLENQETTGKRKKGKVKIMNKTKQNRVVTALGGLPHAGPYIKNIVDTPADPRRLYALGGFETGLNSIYVSRDAGATWSIAHLPFSNVQAVGVSPANADHLLTVREGNPLVISQSTDGGLTWLDLTSINATPGSWIRCVSFSPANANIAYIQVWRAIFRLDLRSRELTAIHNDYWLALAVDRTNADRLFLTTSENFLTSENGGRSWVAKAYPPGLEYAMGMAVDPGNGSRLVVAHKQMFLSEDGGDTWTDLGQVGKSYIDQLAFDPVNPQRIYALDRLTGLTISSNGGRTWNPTSDIVLTTYAREIHSLHVSRITPGLVMAGTNDGLYRSTDGGHNFAAVHDGLQQHSRVVGLAVDPTDPKHVIARTSARIYYSNDAGQTWTQSGGVTSCVDWTQQSLAFDADGKNCYAGNMRGPLLRSTNRGVSFEPVAQAPLFPTIVADATIPGKIFGAWPKVQVSTDGGNSWSVIPGVPNWVWTLAISPVDSKMVYAVAEDTVFRLVTNATTGKQELIAATTPPDAAAQHAIVRQLFAHPLDAKRALAVDNHSSMWQTEDGGATWSPLCSGCFYHPYVRASEPEVIYVSKESGFYAWHDGQLERIDEKLKVNAYAEVSDGLLLGTEMGIYKLTWQ